MGGPWENYAAAPAEGGPWAKYAAAPSGPTRPGMPASSVNMQEVSPGLGGLIKDEAKAAVAHPGQAALGAVNEVGSLARAAMPQTGQMEPPKPGDLSYDPKYDASTPEGKAEQQRRQNSPANQAYQVVSGTVQKVVHPPQTPAETAGAHGADVAAVAANAPAAVKGAVSLVKAGKDIVKNALTVSPEVKAAANAEIPAELQKTASATSNQIKQPVAEKLHSTLHDTINQVAQEHGIQVPETPSAAAKADKVGRGILDKAQSMYKQLDEVSGGRYQRFRDSIDELSDIVRNSKYLNPEAAADAKIKLQEATDRYAALQRRMVKQGVDPDLIGQADKLHNQGRAMLDVSNKVRSAEDLSGTVKAGGVDRLDTGFKNIRKTPAEATNRLNAALGEERANAVRQAIADSQKEIQRGTTAKTNAQASVKNLEESRRHAQQAVERVSKNRMKLVKTGLGTVGIAGGTYEGLKALRGKQ